jgi:hypothetical protein
MAIGEGTDSRVPEEDVTPPRADPREQALPWDMNILQESRDSRPEGGVWGGESVCAKGAAGPFWHSGTTSSTAGSPIASGSYDAGRRRSVSASAEPSRRDARSTPRRNAGVERMLESRLKASRPRRWWLRRSARGHAEEGCRRFSAIGPAVTSLRVNRLASLHATAAKRVLRPCVKPETASASG